MKPYYEDGGCAIYHADWHEALPYLTGDVVVTDPPYGTGGWRRETAGAGADPSGTLVVEAWDDGATDWLRAFAPQAQAVLTFWMQSRALPLLHVAGEAGLSKHRCLYLHKSDPKPQVAGRVAWSVEPVWVLSRDGFQLYGGTDVWRDSTPRKGRDAEATGHPYQKPLALLQWLLGKLGRVGVVDPFMGSGTTLRAAKNLGLPAVGCEREERWCEVAARRLEQLALPLELTCAS